MALRLHFILGKMASIKETNHNNKCWQEGREKEYFYIVGEDVN
jgi:hypothetical protein